MAKSNWDLGRGTFVVLLGSALLTGPLTTISAADTLNDACNAPLHSDAAALLPHMDAEALGAALRSVAAELQAAARQVPATAQDPVAVVAEQGFDPDNLVAWVADETALSPYTGVLHGALGVLIGRRGNSLDRALLLAELLELSGYDVRLARRQLGPGAAAALAPAMRMAPAPTVADVAGRLDTLADDLGLEAAQVAAVAEGVQARVTACQAEIAMRIDEQTQRLVALMAPPHEAGDTPDAHADHWWVQASLGGDWSDYDPDAALIGPQDADEIFDVRALPGDLYHRVTIRLQAEVWSDEVPSIQTVLEYTAPVAEVAFAPMRIAQAPAQLPALDPQVAGDDPFAAYFASLGEVQLWLPALVVGDALYTDRLFSVDGRVEAASRARIDELAAMGPSGMADTAGSLLGGGGLTDGGSAEDEPEASQGALTALWIDIETVTPDRGARIHRREIYDAYGPALRALGALPAPETVVDPQARAFALLFSTEIAIMAGGPSAGVVATAHADASAGALHALADMLDGRDPRALTPSSIALPFAALRADFAGADWMGDVGPSVMLVHGGFLPPTHSAPPSYRLVVDLVETATISPAAPFAAHVRAGVADTVLETTVLDAPAVIGNASVLFAADPDGWELITATEADVLASLAASDDVKARIAADIAAGQVVLVPRTLPADAPAEAFAYWRIDPVTGVTLGIGSLGHGQATTEYSNLTSYLQAARNLWAFHPFLVCSLLDTYGYLETQGERAACMAGAIALWTGSVAAVGVTAAQTAAGGLTSELLRYAATAFGTALWAQAHVRDDLRQLAKDKISEWLFG